MLSFYYFGLPIAAALVLLLLAIRKRTGVGAWVFRSAALGSCLTAAVLVLLILRQKSSTAGIGILFVPFFATLAAPVAGFAGWCLHRVLHWRESLAGGTAGRILLVFALAAIVIGSGYAARSGGRILEFDRAKDPATGPAQLEAIFQGAMERRDYFVLSAVARNPQVSQQVLLALAKSDDAGLHQKRQEFIDTYDRDQMAVVRHALRNPSLPAEAIPLLAQSKDSYVLSDVAAHALTPPSALRQIFQRDDSYLVRWGLAANQHTPQEILEQLARESTEPGAGGADTHRSTRAGLATNTAAPAHVLAALARDPDTIVRRNVALNPAAPPDALAALAADPAEEVRFYLATNKALAEETAEKLLQDSSERVRKYAAQRIEQAKHSAAARPAQSETGPDAGGCDGPTTEIEISFARFRTPSGRRLVMIVSNSTASAIRAISIGSAHHREMLSIPGNVPLTVESPQGWSGRPIYFEESQYMQILWEAVNADNRIVPGRVQQQFAIQTQEPPPAGQAIYGPDGKPSTILDFGNAPFNAWLADKSCRWGRTRWAGEAAK